VIDDLLSSITHDLNITTIINTHDMNSVMGIGENIIFIYKGEKEWQGVSSQVMNSDNKRLTDFIFASDLLKNMRELVIANNKYEHKRRDE
jgi:phospholipid/cholesterol/gamma-HCH transport system ATP-binding protein